MAKVPGGHAIMVDVVIPDALREAAHKWVNAREGRSLPDLSYHITLAFVGRDLDDSTRTAIVAAAEVGARELPPYLFTTGALAMFGGKKDHLVALVEKCGGLTRARSLVIGALEGMNIRPSRDFDFNPHITLAKGVERDTLPTGRPGGYALAIEQLTVKLGSTDRVLVPYVRR